MLLVITESAASRSGSFRVVRTWPLFLIAKSVGSKSHVFVVKARTLALLLSEESVARRTRVLSGQNLTTAAVRGIC